LAQVLSGGDESVAPAGKGFDKARRTGRIAERFPQTGDRGVKAVLEINVAVVGPQLLPDLIPCNHFAAARQKEAEDEEGLFL
jgi:hypothetical protein